MHAWVDERFEKASTGELTVLPKSREEIYPKFDRWLPRIRARVAFQRTLRIPDDGRDYPLPPGFGCFPVFHVDDYAGIPAPWKKHGGVMLPMHRAEAMWLQFSGDNPFALKIAAGGVCAVSGERWSAGLRCKPQNYVVLPEQPWLDGFRVDDDTIRQFVAAPLGRASRSSSRSRARNPGAGCNCRSTQLRSRDSGSNCGNSRSSSSGGS